MSDYIDLTKCLEFLAPNEHWAISDNDYERIEWYSDKPQPSLEELLGVWDEVVAQIEAKEKAKQDARTLAEAKLAALGLTADDLKALGL